MKTPPRLKIPLRDQSVSGVVLFYVLALIPMALSMAVAGVDLARWSSFRDTLQRNADRMALQGARMLPNIDRDAYSHYLQQELRSVPGSQITNLKINDFSIAIEVEAEFPALFDLFLLSPESKSIRQRSVAQVLGTDYVLILPDGASLRPLREGQVLEDAFGSAFEWPASTYFDCSYAPSIANDQTEIPIRDLWNDQNFRRWATQSCFNPILSNIKLAAIGFVEAIQSLQTNRLALIFTPGKRSPQGFASIRSIHGTGSQAGFFDESSFHSNSQVNWDPYIEGEHLLGDEVCALLSLGELSPRYRLEQTAQAVVGGNANCEEPFGLAPCGVRFNPYGRLSSCYLENHLSLREAIYWRAAKFPSTDFSGRPNVTAALGQALFELSNSSGPQGAQQEQAMRGNASVLPKRHVILISDEIPSSSAPNMQSTLAALRQIGAQVTLIALFHEHLNEMQRENLENRLSEYQRLDSALFKTLAVKNPENLNQLLMQNLLVIDRQVVIRS